MTVPRFLRGCLVVVLASVLGDTPTLAQTPQPKASIATRVELHPIGSVTLSDAQFLAGDATGGKPVTVTAELRLAQGTGKLPVVILMHGSSGIGANIEPWVQQLNAMGIATLTIDGFTGRGLTQVGTNQALLGRLNFILDIYRSLDVLAKHPRVDTSRIALMGFSRGGQAALYASLNRFHKLWNTSGLIFQTYIPFYPDCATQYATDTDIADVPVRIFHGTPDDYNPVSSCKAYAERLVAAKRDIVITEYPNAQHGFDSPLAPPSVVSKGSQTVRGCSIKETVIGVLTNTVTNAPFAYTDTCVLLDPHVGGDQEATQQAQVAVKAHLKSVFKLP
jgi:dienelactone hydrolase